MPNTNPWSIRPDRPTDHLPLPEPVQVGLAAIGLHDHINPAPFLRDGVERLVKVRREVDEPLEGLLADGAALGRISEQPEGLLESRDDAAAAAIGLSVVAGRGTRDVHVAPGGALRAAGAHAVSSGGVVGEGKAGVEEGNHLGL